MNLPRHNPTCADALLTSGISTNNKEVADKDFLLIYNMRFVCKAFNSKQPEIRMFLKNNQTQDKDSPESTDETAARIPSLLLTAHTGPRQLPLQRPEEPAGPPARRELPSPKVAGGDGREGCTLCTLSTLRTRLYLN
jgi:hypothetical protein